MAWVGRVAGGLVGAYMVAIGIGAVVLLFAMWTFVVIVEDFEHWTLSRRRKG